MARNAYHRLSAPEKRELARDRMREPAVTCPTCEVQTTPADLTAHLEGRCPGRREPHHRSRWIGWGEARRMGIPKATLHGWVERGRVRIASSEQGRRYLQRDVVLQFANTNRRRNGWTIENGRDPGRAMAHGTALDEKVIQRLQTLARENVGGVEALARKLGIPTPTLRRAMAGGGVRQGTQTLIELRIGHTETAIGRIRRP
jgi:hypothetical protein